MAVKYSEVEILQWMKNLLWDGKGSLPMPEAGGIQKYLCHILDDAKVLLCDGFNLEPIDNIQQYIDDTLCGCGTYIGYLEEEGLIDLNDKEECQALRLKLIDKMIAHFEEN